MIQRALDGLLARLRLKHDYAETFGTPQGRRVLADIMRRAGVTQPHFDANPEKARLLEGHRHLALSIFRNVHASDAPLLNMIAEETARNNTTPEPHN